MRSSAARWLSSSPDKRVGSVRPQPHSDATPKLPTTFRAALIRVLNVDSETMRPFHTAWNAARACRLPRTPPGGRPAAPADNAESRAFLASQSTGDHFRRFPNLPEELSALAELALDLRECHIPAQTNTS